MGKKKPRKGQKNDRKEKDDRKRSLIARGRGKNAHMIPFLEPVFAWVLFGTSIPMVFFVSGILGKGFWLLFMGDRATEDPWSWFEGSVSIDRIFLIFGLVGLLIYYGACFLGALCFFTKGCAKTGSMIFCTCLYHAYPFCLLEDIEGEGGEGRGGEMKSDSPKAKKDSWISFYEPENPRSSNNPLKFV